MAVLDRINRIITRVDDLTLRERAIVFAGLLTVMFLGWYAYLIEPLSKEEKQLVGELGNKREQLQALNDQFTLMTQRQGAGADAANRRKLEGLRAEEARIKEELTQATSHLVKSEAMPDVLRQVLDRSQGLDLVRLSGLGSQPLVPAAKSATPAGPSPGAAQKPAAGEAAKTGETPAAGDLTAAYKHGMEIQFTGDFFSTLAYMRKLEGLEWGFFWDSVDFAVADYPKSAASIRVYTLSLNPNWIGT